MIWRKHACTCTSDNTYAIKCQGGRAYQHIKLTTDVIDQKANCSSIIVPGEKKIAKWLCKVYPLGKHTCDPLEREEIIKTECNNLEGLF